MKEGKAMLQSAGPLAFGPEGILLIADTKAAAIVAVATGDTKAAANVKPLKVEAINEKVAALLGTTADQILITGHGRQSTIAQYVSRSLTRTRTGCRSGVGASES